jgi:hypothetical protein
MITATLRIHSETLSIEDISSLLGLMPTDAKKIGDKVSQRSNASGCHPTNLWILRLVASDNDMDDIVDNILTIITTSELDSAYNGSNYSVEILLNVSILADSLTNSHSLSSKVLQRMSKLDINLLFDFSVC